MKKLIAIAAMAMVVGATMGVAQIVTTTVNNVSILSGPITIDLNASVSSATAKTKVALADVKFAHVRLNADNSLGASGEVFDVIGTSITDTTNILNGAGNTNTTTVTLSKSVFLAGDTSVDLGKGKFAEAFFSRPDTNQVSTMSNAVLYVTGSTKTSTKGTNVTGKIVGIWQEAVSTVSGSIKNSKVQ
jgi:hypothetical protein